MSLGKRHFLLMLLGLGDLCASVSLRAEDRALYTDPPAGHTDSPYSWQAEQRFTLILGEVRTGEGSNARSMRLLKNVLDDRLQFPENLYLAGSAYAITMAGYNDSEAVNRHCSLYPPKADDYRYQATCLWFREINKSDKIHGVQEIAERAYKMFPQSIVASKIYGDLAEWLTNAGRTHEAVLRYKRSFEVVPKNEEAALISAKEGLALVYSNPLLGEKLRRLSIQYYSDVIDWHEAKGDDMDRRRTISHIRYNRGVTAIFLFKDYEKAIDDFVYAMDNEFLGQDARVFLSYTYAQLGRIEESLAIRQQVDFSKVIDQDRRAFLQCYLDLGNYLLKRSTNLESCLIMQEPQIDVLLNLTEILQSLPLTPSEENRLWRRFYRFFSQHLLPDFQESIEAVSSQAELERERADNRLNQLKVQNLSLYQDLSYALAGLAVFLIAIAVLAFRSWHASRRYSLIIAKERQRLQNILDHIEEGIIAIKDDLTMKPEISEHLKAIIGETSLQKAPIDVLLDLTQLHSDQKSLVRECLRSSFGEDRLAWELNSANLPTEVLIAGKHIALYWAPVYHNQLNVAVFLVLHDVTSVRQLEQERNQAVHAADQQLKQARQILANPKSATNFINQLPQQLQKLGQALQAAEVDYQGAFFLVHSIKGTSRSLGLVELQEVSHDLEDCLQSRSRKSLTPAFEQLKLVSLGYRKAMDELVGRWLTKAPTSLFEMVASLRDGVVEQLHKADVELLEIRVVESQTAVVEDLSLIQDILLHGLSNAADHGFVRPRARGQDLAPAVIEIAYRVTAKRKVLTIRDNGVGINHGAVRTLASKVGWTPEDGQSWTDFLFENEVSTAENLSQSSGRGVGLSAIRENARQLGGRVMLMDNDQGSGTLLQVEWFEALRKAPSR